uniref:Uncharacterized protein n=1 Tax=Panagrolaimus superbus TaxID=310955 RepID=A0A914Y2F1_9BILA
MFEENPQLKPREGIKLPQFKFVLYWLNIKLFSYIDEKKEKGNWSFILAREIVQDFKNQFQKLFNAVARFTAVPNTGRFPSKYSEIYHLNAHYNGTKIVIDNFKTCPLNIETSFNTIILTSSELNIEEHLRTKRESNVTSMDDETLDTCAKFYFGEVPLFLFQNFRDDNIHREMGYYKETTTDDTGFTRTKYVAGGVSFLTNLWTPVAKKE